MLCLSKCNKQKKTHWHSHISTVHFVDWRVRKQTQKKREKQTFLGAQPKIKTFNKLWSVNNSRPLPFVLFFLCATLSSLSLPFGLLFDCYTERYPRPEEKKPRCWEGYDSAPLNWTSFTLNDPVPL